MIGSFTIDDLALFADLGTDPPRVSSIAIGDVVRFVRNGREIELVLHADGTVAERDDEGGERRHKNARALLASSSFGDLGRWADAQKAFLSEKLAGETIPVLGTMTGKDGSVGIDGIDETIIPVDSSSSNHLRILLVDGPAGIGKTGIIRALAARRAQNYRLHRRPLVLHVESRGRVLQNIVDLMAFSLQTLRVNVTYDQVPVLVRNGLLTLAIDGFDELADPNGYGLAWAQVNELVDSVRGRGSVLLAGRETFIGRDRLVSALKAFREDTDELYTYTVRPILPSVAKSWLRGQGWGAALFNQENIEPLFEPGSYALRPFFLVELAREGVRDQVEHGAIDDLTWFLVETMLDREAEKFGSDVENITTPEERQEFLRRFLCEVARDLADNQTEAIANETLSWMAELVALDSMPESLSGILKNRASVVAFLTGDDRRGYKRFSHTHLLNHFLGRVTFDALLSCDVPKYVRRNILGSDFLVSFSDVVSHYSADSVEKFVSNAVDLVKSMGDSDRSRRNLSALILVASGFVDEKFSASIEDVFIDEVSVAETLGRVVLKNVIMAQLDARGADLRDLVFESECHIISLIADAGTRLPDAFPHPQRVQLPDRILSDSEEIGEWLSRSIGRDNGVDIDNADLMLSNHGIVELLGRACRYRSFWLRDGEQRATRRILQDPYWDTLRTLLQKHDLLTVRTDVPASGQAGEFFHIRRKDEILAGTGDPQIQAFYRDVVEAINVN